MYISLILFWDTSNYINLDLRDILSQFISLTLWCYDTINSVYLRHLDIQTNQSSFIIYHETRCNLDFLSNVVCRIQYESTSSIQDAPFVEQIFILLNIFWCVDQFCFIKLSCWIRWLISLDFLKNWNEEYYCWFCQ